MALGTFVGTAYKVSALDIFDQAFGSTEALLDTLEVLLLLLVRLANCSQMVLAAVV